MYQIAALIARPEVLGAMYVVIGITLMFHKSF